MLFGFLLLFFFSGATKAAAFPLILDTSNNTFGCTNKSTPSTENGQNGDTGQHVPGNVAEELDNEVDTVQSE